MKHYHISHRLILDTIYPKVPLSSRVDGEPLMPRICVSPTISQCLLAVNWYPDNNVNVYVYSTDAKTVQALGVRDVKWTGERWILNPVNLTLIYNSKEYFSELNNRWREFVKTRKEYHSLVWTPPEIHCPIYLEWLKNQIPPKELESAWA